MSRVGATFSDGLSPRVVPVQQNEVENSTFFNKILPNVEPLLHDTYHLICDSELRFRYVGEKFANILSTPRDIFIGQTLAEINCPLQEYSLIYKELNLSVIKTKTNACYATILYLNNEISIFKSVVRPIFHNTKIQGIFIETNCIKDNFTNFGLNIFSMLSTKNIIIHNYAKEARKQEINDIEELILFLVIIGKSNKDISNVLERLNTPLSTSAISKILTRKLYPKLNISSRNQLIDKCFQKGFSNQLPKMLLGNPHLFKIISTAKNN